MFTCSQDENGNSKGQLGIGSEDAQELHQWHHVHGLKKEEIVNIACGSEHTLAQCKNDSVYGFGSNLFGQLGLGEYKKSTEIKTFPARINLYLFIFSFLFNIIFFKKKKKKNCSLIL